MTKTKNQHYIPESYLRGFAFQKNKNQKNNPWYVYTRINGGKIIHNNIKKVCSQRYLYDLAKDGKGESQIIENFYANHVESYFPEILAFAKDEDNHELTDEMRDKILLTCITLAFRTPKFLTQFPDFVSLFDLNSEDIKRDIKEFALVNHLKKSIELIEQKHNDGIVICKAEEGSQFISCDNPVLISKPNKKFDDYFDPSNIFFIPISPEYLISITPSEDLEFKKYFARTTYDKKTVYVINSEIKKNHQTFLFGAKNGIEEFETNMRINKSIIGNLNTKDKQEAIVALFAIKKIFTNVFGPDSKEAEDFFKGLIDMELLEVFENKTNTKV